MESNVNKEEEIESSNTTFSNDKHARRLLAALNSSRNDENFCDGVVIIGQNRLHVQKAVLAAASHYFKSVYSYGVKNNSEKSEVDLTSMEITTETFQTILDYIYTSEIKLCEDNIQDILQASDVLLLGDLKEMCCEYLEGCITPHNCLGILEFSGRFSCPWVHLKVSQYIDEHFRDVVKTEEFMKLDAKVLTDLLKSKTINLSDDMVLDCLLEWYEYNKEERDVQVGTVLQSCFNGLHVLGFEMERLLPELYAKCDCMNLPPRGLRDVIVVCGGDDLVTTDDQEDFSNEVLSSVYCVDPIECQENLKVRTYRRWRSLAPMLTPRTGHSVVECGGCIYALGGRTAEGNVLNTGEKYDPLTNTWTAISDMLDSRIHFGIVSIKDNIYVLGGSKTYVDPMPSVEVYNIFTNTWRKLPDMNIRRQWFSCVALDKTIFVIGGGSQHTLFESVECFDTLTETWYSASPLREKRCNGRAVPLNGDIFLFGGMRRIECPSAMMHGGSIKYCGNEIYSPQTGTWNSMLQRVGQEGLVCAHPEKSRVDSAVVIGDIIYVIGKLDLGVVHKQTIRGFDRRTHSWFCAVPDPPDYRAPLTCCTVKIPNFVFQG